MKNIKKLWHQHPDEILIGVIAFFYLAGVIQYALELTYILRLMPIFLAVMAAIMLVVWKAPPRTKAALAVSVVVTGYIIELIGVHTGWLFGDYTYGTTLGVKMFGVPVTIGLTWLMVTLSAWHIVGYGNLKTLHKFLLAGALVVMLDLILEQFAVSFGLWSWRGGDIPLYNYICWFGFSQLFFGLYHIFIKKFVPNIFVASLLPMMAIFFWLMLLFS